MEKYISGIELNALLASLYLLELSGEKGEGGLGSDICPEYSANYNKYTIVS